MSDLLRGTDSAVVYLDNILIATPTLDAHNAILDSVLLHLKESGLHLNANKCHFAKSHVEFLGHSWSAAGVTPDTRKLDAISQMLLPSTGKQLRSFLGLVSYLGSHAVPHFSTLVAPLWQLPKAGSIADKWTEELSAIFHHLKVELLAIQSRVYFDPSKCITIFTDASGTGIAGVLMQDGNPVIFVSRTLPDIKKHFPTIEKEFLTIIFTLTKLRMYLVSCSFDVYTDHKPIDSLSHQLPHWILNIQQFHFNLSYLRRQLNVLADALSHFPVSCTDSSITDAENPEYTLCFLLKSSPVDMKAVALATAADPSLCAASPNSHAGP